MTLQELESIAAGLAPVMMKTVSAATAPLLKRIADLEQRPDAEAVRQIIEDAVAKAAAPQFDVEAITTRWDEKHAAVEASVATVYAMAEELAALPTLEQLVGSDELAAKFTVIAEGVTKAALDALPQPNDGKDADPELIRTMVSEVVALIPAPENGKDGRDGTDGKDGADGRHGEKGADGTDGKDGVGLAGALLDKSGALVVTLTDGSMRELGLVVGRDGVDGAKGDPGRDGLQVTDFDTDLSADGRFLTLILQNDEAKIEHRLQLPTMIYRGGFKEGETYLEGDCVTFGGSLWHCSAETTEKPIEGRDCWQLAARKGRDGKDAKA
jgi:hypothetical protein